MTFHFGSAVGGWYTVTYYCSEERKNCTFSVRLSSIVSVSVTDGSYMTVVYGVHTKKLMTNSFTNDWKDEAVALLGAIRLSER